jgi:hypothetical protein
MIENSYAIGYGIVIDSEKREKLYDKFLEQGMTEEEFEELFDDKYCPIISTWTNEGYFLGIVFYIDEDTSPVKPISKFLDVGTRFAFDRIFKKYNLINFLWEDMEWEPAQQLIHFTH